MKKLSRSETIGVAVAIALVGFLLFGAQFWGLFSNGSTNANIAGSSTETATTTMDIPASGVKSVDLTVGTGTPAQIGDQVTVQYVGMLTDGKVFDSSYDRNQPFTFTLGAGQVIKGWDQGLVGMKVGGSRRLIIAPDYGYGSQSVGPIPANSALIFDVELLNVTK